MGGGGGLKRQMMTRGLSGGSGGGGWSRQLMTRGLSGGGGGAGWGWGLEATADDQRPVRWGGGGGGGVGA